jgi:hypothetical protein
MKVIDKGIIFEHKTKGNWSCSHVQVPYAINLNIGTTRVFFATRDFAGRSLPSYVDLKSNTYEIIQFSDQPLMSLGQNGDFDDSGVMPSCFIKRENELWMYYTGWNIGSTVDYRLGIGLAVSKDNGETFNRVFRGPIMDRSNLDNIWVAQPFVMQEEHGWRMWYLSCVDTKLINNINEPIYIVKTAFSENGIDWQRNNQICIDFKESEVEAIGRPFVWKHENLYYMLHSNRLLTDYRNNLNAGYNIVLSTSHDGIIWNQGINEISKNFKRTNWNSIMCEYTSLIKNDLLGCFDVFYNGNGFGKSGVGSFQLYL